MTNVRFSLFLCLFAILFSQGRLFAAPAQPKAPVTQKPNLTCTTQITSDGASLAVASKLNIKSFGVSKARNENCPAQIEVEIEGYAVAPNHTEGLWTMERDNSISGSCRYFNKDGIDRFKDVKPSDRRLEKEFGSRRRMADHTVTCTLSEKSR